MGRRMKWLIVFIALVTLWGGRLALAESSESGASKKQGAHASNPVAQEPEFAGAAACAMCHEAETSTFGRNPHSKMVLAHGGKGVTCEGCHGSAKEHIDGGGDASKIFSFTRATADQVEKKCLTCHQGDHEAFQRSAHAEAKVVCTSCHSVHQPQAQNDPQLLRASQQTLCTQCHKDVKSSFSKPFHHKVNEGLMKCTDCHDPHGTFEKSMTKTAAQQDQVCVKCHQENAGPFIYEHPVVKTEGCTFCHSPHGSSNPRLLARNNLNQLCLQCHTGTEASHKSDGRIFNAGGPPTSPAHDQSMQYTSCIECHSQIHGSNLVDTFIR
jgi:DmsE family decaheme c-type cytochrome